MDEKVYFEYLDELRESGLINMWQSPQLLEEDFCMSRQQAERIVLAWMESKR